jgi:hypothetical protein
VVSRRRCWLAAHRSSIDVQEQFDAALDQHGHDVEQAEQPDDLERLTVDGTIDDASLKLQRRQFKKEQGYRQH